MQSSQVTRELQDNKAKKMRETIVLGGGCFWCLEAVFQQVRGVEKVISGYMGGSTESPQYAQVCQGDTGHAEVVWLEFDS